MRGSIKFEGEKDVLGREERDISDTTSTPHLSPESQLNSPQAETDVTEPDHTMVDTNATPPSGPQAEAPKEPSQPSILQEEVQITPRRSTQMRKPTSKFNMTQLGGGKK